MIDPCNSSWELGQDKISPMLLIDKVVLCAWNAEYGHTGLAR